MQVYVCLRVPMYKTVCVCVCVCERSYLLELVSSLIHVGVCIWVCSVLCVCPAEPMFAHLWGHTGICA